VSEVILGRSLVSPDLGELELKQFSATERFDDNNRRSLFLDNCRLQDAEIIPEIGGS
jgi:hypothetical protein